MFDGALPPPVLALVEEHVKDWPTDQPLWIGCSGAFGVERALAALKRPMHSNDVTLYSTVIGRFLAGNPLPDLQFSQAALDQFPWLDGYLGQSGQQDVAVVMLCSKLAAGFERPNHAYHARLAEGMRLQWEELLHATVTRVEDVAGGLHLASYTAEDVFTWIERSGDEPLIVDPPNESPDGAGYYRGASDPGAIGRLTRMFQWESPEYHTLDPDRVVDLIDTVVDREHWCLCTRVEHPALRADLRGKVDRGKKAIWVYSSAGTRRYATRRPTIPPLMVPKLPPETVLRPDAEIGLLEISAAQLVHLQGMYRHHTVDPDRLAMGVSCAVLVDGVLVGGFGISSDTAGLTGVAALPIPSPTALLLGHFPVAPTVHTRLDTLVAAAALSTDARLLFERSVGRRFGSVAATVSSATPDSATYTAPWRLLRIADSEVPEGFPPRWAIVYGSALATAPLTDLYRAWHEAHGAAILEAEVTTDA